MCKKLVIYISILIILILGFVKNTNAQLLYPINTVKIDKVNETSINNVRKIVRDKYGFIWVASQDGLVKYNSKTFVFFNATSIAKKNITSLDIRDMSYDSALNKLYLFISNGEIIIIDVSKDIIENKFDVKTNFSKKALSIRSVTANKQFIFIASSNGIFRFDKFTYVLKHLTLSNYPNLAYTANIIILRNLLFVFAPDNKIMVYDVINLAFIKLLTFKKSAQNIVVNNVVTNGVSSILLATNCGLKSIEFSKNEILVNDNKYQFIGNEYKNNIFSVAIDDKSRIWLASENNFLLIDEKSKTCKKIIESSNTTSIWLKSIYALYYDEQHQTMWMGCLNGLAYANYNESAFSKYNECEDGKTTIDHAYYLYPLNDSIVYACAENGFFKTNVHLNKVSIIDNTKTYDYVFKDGDGNTIVSNANGLFVYENKKFIPINKKYREFTKFGLLRFNSSCKVNDSIFCFGTENHNGIILWNYKAHKIENFKRTNVAKLNVPEDIINYVYTIEKNKIAVLSDNFFSVVDYPNNTLKSYQYVNTNKKKCNFYFDLCKVKNKYYLATYGSGIVVLNESFEQTEIINTATNLTNNAVYKIIPWIDSLLFITTNYGLNIFNTKTKIINHFFEEQGLNNNVFEETSANIFGNKIYVGGMNGFTKIEPSLIKHDKLLTNLLFSSVVIKLDDGVVIDTTNLETSILKIPSNTLQTTVNFCDIDFSRKINIGLQYRISEKGRNWLEMEDKTSIDFIGLPPGKYHLQIKNEKDNHNSIKELTLHFLPKWYQTILFKILVALSIIGILGALYNFRIRQLKKIISVRKKISSDLHDDIGSTLSTINMYSQIAQLQPNNPTHAASIQENTKEVLEKLDDIVWATNPKNDQIKNLIERMDSFARPFLQAKGIQFNFTHTPKIETTILNEATRQNLFLIFKEAVNNTCKYAKASNCTTTLTLKNKTLHCSITDDGIGFNTTSPTQRNGLLNMQQRVAQLKGKIVVDSVMGVGTTITLQLPV